MSDFKFKDQIWQHPRRYIIENNNDGTVDIIPSKGESLEDGIPLNAENLNKLSTVKVASGASEPDGLSPGDIWFREV